MNAEPELAIFDSHCLAWFVYAICYYRRYANTLMPSTVRRILTGGIQMAA